MCWEVAGGVVHDMHNQTNGIGPHLATGARESTVGYCTVVDDSFPSPEVRADSVGAMFQKLFLA
jgi:hypothetical protein